MRNVLSGLAFILTFVAFPLFAQETSTQEATTTAETIVSNWIAQCVGQSREGQLDCSLDRSISLKETGQQLAKISLRVPGESRAPAMLIQIPHGLFLPAGLEIQIDDGDGRRLNLETCDANGCYTATDLTAEALDEMIKGLDLKLTFQNLANDTITVSMPLTGFTDAYNKVK